MDHRARPDRPSGTAVSGDPRPLRPRWLVVLFLAVQVAIPTIGLVLRWTGGPIASPFSWHMFSTL